MNPQLEETPTESPSPTASPTETPPETPRKRTCETAWEPTTLWTLTRAARVYAPTVTSTGLVVPTDAGLLAVAPADGTVRWSQPDAPGHLAASGDGRLFVSDLSQLVAIDAATGSVEWTFTPPGKRPRVPPSVGVANDTVYVGAAQVPTPSTDVETEYGRLYGLAAATGDQRFRRDLSPSTSTVYEPQDVLADAGGAYVTYSAGTSGGVLGVDRAGRRRWQRAPEEVTGRPEFAAGTLVVPVDEGLMALDPGTGAVDWRDQTRIRKPTAADGVVYGAEANGPNALGVLTALDAKTGRHRWETYVTGCGGRPAVGDGVIALYIGCLKDAGIALFDTATGCRYGTFQQPIDAPALVSLDEDRLYARLGEDRTTIGALPRL